MIRVGDLVRVVSTTEMCCGVVMQGNVSEVKYVVDIPEGVVCILADNSLHWIEDLEKI